jgi:methyl-accepting chemotaxis protein
VKPPSPEKTRKYSLLNGLGRSLGIAFLLFAILPMAVSGVVSYQKAYDNLRQAAEIALKTSALLKTREIQAYFEELLTDLHHQADTDSATRLMAVLIDAQRAAGQSADAFVKSYQWALIDDEYGSDLKKVRTAHMYYDVFLISNQGDILFTVAREEDLGANLFSPPYDRTKFTAAVRRSLSTGQPTFSDYERWRPSNDQLFGFMVDAIVNRNGDKIGVIAFQFPIGPINDIMEAQTGLGKTAETYLVGPDFSLRSNSILDPDLPLVTEKIDTYQTRLLKQHWGRVYWRLWRLCWRRSSRFGRVRVSSRFCWARLSVLSLLAAGR